MTDSEDSSALFWQLSGGLPNRGLPVGLRIRVCESLTIPAITRGVDGALLSINAELSFEDIDSFIGDQFLEGERELAYSLWADGASERIFTPIEGTSDFFIELR